MDDPALQPTWKIVTPRLTLRAYTLADADWYAEMSVRNHTHLERYETGNPALQIQDAIQAEAVLRSFCLYWDFHQSFFWGAFEKETQTFVTQIYVGTVNWDLPEFEIGYFVDQTYQGRGYVQEAVRGVLHWLFMDLHAQRACLDCDDTNLRSQHVAQRCGFVQEGHIRQNKRHADGSITGTLLYGMLPGEFDEALKAA